jgi:hypothetical protein
MAQFRLLLLIGRVYNGNSLRLFHRDLMTHVLQGCPEQLASIAVHYHGGTPDYSI